ncbi:MAG: PEGA domain-containing protein [Planctomycetota bacterium]
MNRPNARRMRLILVMPCALSAAAGCVRRTLTIQTEPVGALVLLNDEEIGRSPVTTDFTWYGDYDVIIRHEGYETLNTPMTVRRPWYQVPPIDFVAEILWPGHIVDARSYTFELTEAQPPDREELIDRAQALRERALYEAD